MLCPSCGGLVVVWVHLCPLAFHPLFGWPNVCAVLNVAFVLVVVVLVVFVAVVGVVWLWW